MLFEIFYWSHWQSLSVFSGGGLSQQVPQTLSRAHSYVGIATNEFIEHVVCPSCHSIYEYKDCIHTVGGEKVSKYCRSLSWIGMGTHCHKLHFLNYGNVHQIPEKEICHHQVIIV